MTTFLSQSAKQVTSFLFKGKKLEFEFYSLLSGLQVKGGAEAGDGHDDPILIVHPNYVEDW